MCETYLGCGLERADVAGSADGSDLSTHKTRGTASSDPADKMARARR